MADETFSETMTVSVPDEPLPAAVVRRRGETRGDMRLRGAGFEYGGGMNRTSPLARAAEMSLKRDNLERQNRAQTLAELQRQDSLKRMDLDERRFEHKKTFDIFQREDAQQELNDSVSAAREVATFDVNDPEFDVKVSEVVSKYPRALNNQRFRGMLEYRDKLRFANIQNRMTVERNAFGQGVEMIANDDGTPNYGATIAALNARRAEREAKAKAELPPNAVFAGATVKNGEVTQRFAPMEEQKAKEVKPDSYDQFNKDLEAVKKAYGVKVEKDANGKIKEVGNIPDFLQKAFEARGKELEAQAGASVAPQPQAQPTPAAAPKAKPAQTPEEWLQLNPDDPRAPAIRAKLGIK